jgi:hypothetical protein
MTKPKETWFWCEKDKQKQAISVCKVKCPGNRKKHCSAWLEEFARAIINQEKGGKRYE